MSRSVQRRLDIQRAEQAMVKGYIPPSIPTQRRRILILSPTPITTVAQGDSCPMP